MVKLFISKVEINSRRIIVRAHRKTFGTGLTPSGVTRTGFTLLVILAMLGIAMPAMACDAAWRDANWSHRKEVTIDKSKIVADQKDFPVLINVGYDPDLAAQAQTGGGDIIFTLGDGKTKLPCKVESYSGGSLVAWVKVPQLSSAENTKLFVYYGNPAAVNEQDTKGAWVDVYKGNWRRRDIVSWVQTEYNNHNSPSTFATLGTDEAKTADVTASITTMAVVTPETTAAATDAPTQTTLWNDCGWSYRKSVTIDHLRVAADQTDFTILINLPSDVGLASHAQADGDDILFTLSDEVTKVPLKIENYTSATGALVAWVKIPVLSSTKNTMLYMYYGNPAATSQQDTSGTWSYRFKGTWNRKAIASWVQTKYNNQMYPGSFYTLGAEMYQPQSCAPTPVPTATPTPVPTSTVITPVETPTPTATPADKVVTPTPTPTTVEPTVTPTPVEPTVTPTPVEPTVTPTPVPTPAPAPAFSCPAGSYGLVTAEGKTTGCVAITNNYWAQNATTGAYYDALYVAFTTADSTCLTGASVALADSAARMPATPQFSVALDPEAGSSSYTYDIELPSNYDDVSYFYVSVAGSVREKVGGVASADIAVSAKDNPIEYIIQF
jgi:hypothetical protein